MHCHNWKLPGEPRVPQVASLCAPTIDTEVQQLQKCSLSLNCHEPPRTFLCWA
jgi:hypothetical protein